MLEEMEAKEGGGVETIEFDSRTLEGCRNPQKQLTPHKMYQKISAHKSFNCLSLDFYL